MELTLDELIIAARYDNGESTIALSRDTGISRYEINRILGAAGVKRRRSHTIATLPESTRRWIARLYLAGAPKVRISRELGLEASLVSIALDVEGVTGRQGAQVDDQDEEPRRDETETPTSIEPAEVPYVEPPEDEAEPSMTAGTAKARRTAYLIVAAYLEGNSLEAISERFGYPAWRIVRILKSADVTLLVESRPRTAADLGAVEGDGDQTSDSHLPTPAPESDLDDWRQVVEAHYADEARSHDAGR